MINNNSDVYSHYLQVSNITSQLNYIHWQKRSRHRYRMIPPPSASGHIVSGFQVPVCTKYCEDYSWPSYFQQPAEREESRTGNRGTVNSPSSYRSLLQQSHWESNLNAPSFQQMVALQAAGEQLVDSECRMGGGRTLPLCMDWQRMGSLVRWAWLQEAGRGRRWTTCGCH